MEEVGKRVGVVATRSFDYGPEAPLAPMQIDGPGSQTEDRYYGLVELGFEDYLIGDGIIPTEISRRRHAGVPLVTRWGLALIRRKNRPEFAERA